MNYLKSRVASIRSADRRNKQDLPPVPVGCVVPELCDAEQRLVAECERQEDALSISMTQIMKEDAQQRVLIKQLQSQRHAAEIEYDEELRQIAALKYSLGDDLRSAEQTGGPQRESGDAENRTSLDRAVDADVLLEELRRGPSLHEPKSNGELARQSARDSTRDSGGRANDRVMRAKAPAEATGGGCCIIS